MTDNYYEDLGVEPGASRDELREAHRQRVADLEAARDRKGISESQLQANRDEVARVRTAWNVLSDPFQRQRYDARLEQGPGEEVEIVDDDDPGPQAGTETQLTGWRKLLAPPPPKNGTNGGNGNAKGAQANRKPRPEPTVVLPAGMKLAEPRVRGMALLFDMSILIVIFFAVSFALPQLIQSDYTDIQDRIAKVSDLHDAREDVIDAQKSVADAKNNSDRRDAESDLDDAQKDYNDARKDARDADVPARFLSTEDPPSPKQLERYGDTLSDDIRTTGFIIQGAILVLGLAYLVPITARKGYTLGMRNRKLRVVRVDGSPCGWYPAIIRFGLPLLLAVSTAVFGSFCMLLGLGVVAWGYFDRNGQGIHDKLARTLVVDA